MELALEGFGAAAFLKVANDDGDESVVGRLKRGEADFAIKALAGLAAATHDNAGNWLWIDRKRIGAGNEVAQLGKNLLNAAAKQFARFVAKEDECMGIDQEKPAFTAADENGL